MAPDLDPYFSKLLPKLNFPDLVWELVVKMLQPSRSLRNPKFECCSELGPLLFQNGPKAYLSRFGLGAGGQNAATEQIN